VLLLFASETLLLVAAGERGAGSGWGLHSAAGWRKSLERQEPGEPPCQARLRYPRSVVPRFCLCAGGLSAALAGRRSNEVAQRIQAKAVQENTQHSAPVGQRAPTDESVEICGVCACHWLTSNGERHPKLHFGHELEPIDFQVVFRLPISHRKQPGANRVGTDMGKVEGTVWICGTIVVLAILFYSVGGVGLVASLYDKMTQPSPPATAAPAQPASG